MDRPYWEQVQPLRIPGGGWTILFNKLEVIEPEEVPEEDRKWLFTFTEDILYMYVDTSRKGEKQKLAIDLGWYPDGDPAGSFCLQAVLNDNWEFPLLKYSSRSKRDVVSMMEKWLFQEFAPPRFIEEDVFRKNHS